MAFCVAFLGVRGLTAGIFVLRGKFPFTLFLLGFTYKIVLTRDVTKNQPILQAGRSSVTSTNRIFSKYCTKDRPE